MEINPNWPVFVEGWRHPIRLAPSEPVRSAAATAPQPSHAAQPASHLARLTLLGPDAAYFRRAA